MPNGHAVQNASDFGNAAASSHILAECNEQGRDEDAHHVEPKERCKCGPMPIGTGTQHSIVVIAIAIDGIGIGIGEAGNNVTAHFAVKRRMPNGATTNGNRAKAPWCTYGSVEASSSPMRYEQITSSFTFVKSREADVMTAFKEGRDGQGNTAK